MGSIVLFYTCVALIGAMMDRRERKKRQTYRLRRFVTTGSLKPWQGFEGKNESLFARLRRGFATDHAWASILYSPLGATILMSRTQRAVMSVAELICGLAVAAFFYGREQEVSADSLTTVDWRKYVLRGLASSLLMMPVGIIAKNSFVGINLLHSRTLGRQRARAKFRRAMGRMRKKHARARMMRKLKKLNEARKPATKAEEVLAGAQSGEASRALSSVGVSDGHLSVPQPDIGLGGRGMFGRRMDDDEEVTVSDAKESKSPD